MPVAVFEQKFVTTAGTQWREIYRQELTLPSYQIGRSMLSDISLSFTGVRSLSNVQATLLQSPETIRHRQGYILRDGSISKKSTNGCFYNGKKVERLKLAHLDTIYLAPTLRLIYLDEGFHKISRDLEATLADAFDAGNFEDT